MIVSRLFSGRVFQIIRQLKNFSFKAVYACEKSYFSHLKNICSWAGRSPKLYNNQSPVLNIMATVNLGNDGCR